jgi:hypothetical protein
MEKILGLALIAFLFTSCEDTSAPVINLVSPTMHSHHTGGEMMHMEVEFTDDKELQSYEIYFGDMSGNPIQGAFDTYSESITGKSHNVHEMVMADSVTEAFIYISVMDAAGNSADQSVMIHVD